MRTLSLGNGWEVVRDMTEWVAGAHVPKSGLTLTGFLSLTKTGATIHADVSTALTEVGSTGTYNGALLGTNLTAQLSSLLTLAKPKRTIYERVTGPDYSDYEPILLVGPRQVGE